MRSQRRPPRPSRSRCELRALLTALTPTTTMSSKWLAVVLLLLPLSSVGQRQILGDITEQRISQVYDEDVREENLYRRPPTYLIIASKIVRPSTIYQVRAHTNQNLSFYFRFLYFAFLQTCLKCTFSR